MKIELNLLPPHKKEEVRMSERFFAILGWEAAILSLAAVFFGFIFGIDYLLNFNLESVTDNKISESSESQYERIRQYEDKFSKINNRLTKISNITNGQIYWSELFWRLNQAMPENIEINGVSNKDFAIFIAGKAKEREDLLLLRDRLEEVDCFANVNLPLTDLVSKEDIVFQIDLEIKENCLKK